MTEKTINNKTEAAQTMANEVVVWARKHKQALTYELCVARVSEFRGSAGNTADGSRSIMGAAADLANPWTVLKEANKAMAALPAPRKRKPRELRVVRDLAHGGDQSEAQGA